MKPLTRLLLVALALQIVGCTAGAAPTPTARSVVNVLEGLALRGATIRQAVGGDAGCPSVPLHGNAVRLVLTLGDSTEQHEVHLFRWRRPAQYDAAADEFARCLEEYDSRAAGEVQLLELRPWRAFGPDWSSELVILLEESLRAAGGGV